MKNVSAIFVLLGAYLIMLLILARMNKVRPGLISYNKPQQRDLELLNYVHAIGILVMLLPALIIKQLPVFLLAFPGKISVEQAIAFLAGFGIIGFFPWKKFSDETYKSEDILPSATAHIILYFFLRIVFLLMYEWFFRGLLLISFSDWLNISPAIAINILLYVLIHGHKSKKEMIGCIPLGLLLCVFTIWWQSIWPAIIFHLQIVIINEWPPLQQFISPQKQTAI